MFFYDIERLFEHELTKRENISLLVNIPEEGKIFLMSDSTRVKQIIINLLSNAFKFTKEGVIELNYNIEDNYIKIWVKDSGVGIPEDKLEHIFEKFTQVDASFTREYGGVGLGLAISITLIVLDIIKVDASFTREYGGVGLGLAISRKLAQLLGGLLTVESEINIGSTFTLKIPYRKMKINKSSIIHNKEKIEIKGQGEKILVVDDVIENTELFSNILVSAGYEVLVCHNGQTALDIYKNTKDIRLVFLDLQMPVMDGFVALRKIKEYENENNINKINIIALTAHASIEDEKMCKEAGFDDYLSKPFKIDELLEKVRVNI